VIARELSSIAATTTGLAPTTARDVRMLVDGHAKYTALLEDIASARDSIDMEYYIFAPDRIGTAVRDALVERARAGVRVRLLVDAVGSAQTKDRFFAPLQAAGGHFAWFHPLRMGRLWRRPWLNLRTHRKIAIIDARVAYTGGINVTDDEDESLGPDAYRDLHLRVEGEVVQPLQVVFAEDWSYATGQPPLVPPCMPEAGPGRHPTQVLVSGPDSNWETIHRLHVSAIHSASRRVWLTTPYFVPSDAAMMALTSAALGGLDVRLMVPRRTDSMLVTFAARSYFDELLAAGVRVYEYGPRMLHSKALLVDDHIVIIGSANFDHRSFRLNFEVSLLFHDARIAGELERTIEGDLAYSPRVRPDRPQPLFRARLPEALARLVSPLL
jgi:cardiolipin synthase A/B